MLNQSYNFYSTLFPRTSVGSTSEKKPTTHNIYIYIFIYLFIYIYIFHIQAETGWIDSL